ncbi:hypothetical protein [Paucibacter sp. PLA-PC-4]|uniref:hypothetical protein n=1 Tax=Paucibacter sp. PLA-PC-4 TaxID=2993655 RepID=UPI00224B9024|nr:hypothetical protein [Paucibacter sp. PLA-PC-4]
MVELGSFSMPTKYVRNAWKIGRPIEDIVTPVCPQSFSIELLDALASSALLRTQHPSRAQQHHNLSRLSPQAEVWRLAAHSSAQQLRGTNPDGASRSIRVRQGDEGVSRRKDPGQEDLVEQRVRGATARPRA